MLIQIHMLQNYAPANLNRDDTGSPKDAIFGGKRRSRISSQCLKRAIRRSETFATAFENDGLLANRTKRLPHLISAELERQNIAEADRNNIIARLPELGGGKKLKEGEEPKTALLIFLGATEVPEIATRLLALYRDVGVKKYAGMKIREIEKAIVHTMPKSVDIAMFGRMTTSVAFEDVHAAVQVAHALSANAVEQEFDYFTAVDDLKPESEDAGAGMIGDIEFNSSTYYKYVNIHWEKLVENLGGDDEVATRSCSDLSRSCCNGKSIRQTEQLCRAQSTRFCARRSQWQQHAGQLCQCLYQTGYCLWQQNLDRRRDSEAGHLFCQTAPSIRSGHRTRIFHLAGG